MSMNEWARGDRFVANDHRRGTCYSGLKALAGFRLKPVLWPCGCLRCQRAGVPPSGSVDVFAVLESGTQENRKMRQNHAIPEFLSSRLICAGNITTDPEGGTLAKRSVGSVGTGTVCVANRFPVCAPSAPPAAPVDDDGVDYGGR